MVNDKLNALVAEKVMEWKRCTDIRAPEGWIDPAEPLMVSLEEPDFLTWSSVGLIVQAMEKKGLYLSLQHTGVYWYASFAERDKDYAGSDREAVDPDAPTAVAKAALKALGIEAAQ